MRFEMSSNFTKIEDLDTIWAALTRLDPDKKLIEIGIKRVTISKDAHLRVKNAIVELFGKDQEQKVLNIAILSDSSLIYRNERLLRDLVFEQLENEFNAKLTILKSENGPLHCEEHIIEQAVHASSSSDLIITIGSGTLTDIGKLAARENMNVPHIALQTAASVDGFTDNVSIILKDGVKRTVPSAWPTIVLADLETISSAPLEMNLAGFGEAISLFTAPADWFLAHSVGIEKNFHSASLKMLEETAASPPDWSAGLVDGDPEAVYNLTKLLALRGIVPGVSGTTACLSGVEHTISHMLDLYRGAKGLEIGLHGEQVGLGSLIASRLWHQTFSDGFINLEELKKPDLEDLFSRVSKIFNKLDDNGLIAAECWRDCKNKYQEVIRNWPKIINLVEKWNVNRSVYSDLVTHPKILEKALRLSGAPSSFSELKFPIDQKLATWAVTNCHLMRNRFTLVDLLDLLGLWTEETVKFSLEGLIGE